MKKILMACSQYWGHPLQVGSLQIAKILARNGWQVAYISFPISPWHLLVPPAETRLRDRFALYRQGGRSDLNDRIWAYVPGTLVAPANKMILKSDWIHKNWHQLAVPNLVNKIKEHGFGKIDVLYFDSIYFNLFLDRIEYKTSIYRAADDLSVRDTYCSAVGREQKELIRRADIILYPSLGVKNSLGEVDQSKLRYFSNGVVVDDYAPIAKRPDEYKTMAGPIAVFIGSMTEWLDFSAINRASEVMPDVSFVFIGPTTRSVHNIIRRSNVHLLGERQYRQLPGYLQHADVGLIPFNVKRYPRKVEGCFPAKLYQYFTCGLPVVANNWEELKGLKLPVLLSDDDDSFVGNIKKAISEPGSKEDFKKVAREHDWGRLVLEFFNTLVNL